MTYSVCSDSEQEILKKVCASLEMWWIEFVPLGINSHNFFISGGIIPNLIQYHLSNSRMSFKDWFADPLSDVDVWYNILETPNGMNRIVSPFELKARKRFSANYVEKFPKGYFSPYNSDHAFNIFYPTSLSDKVQIITCDSGNPREVIKTFDLEHVKGYYDLGQKKLYMTLKQIDACFNKKLIITGGKGINSSENKFKERLRKWERRGYKHIIM